MEISDREKGIYKVTLVGSAVNLILLVFKFVAAVLGRSSAMMADAVHSLSDFLTDIVVLFFVRLSSRPEDEDHDYGHGKYETLASAIIGLALLLVGLGILFNGITSVVSHVRGELLERPGMLALVAAVVSIAFKEGVYQYTVRRGKSLQSPTVVANAWHHRSDALSSVGTLLGIAGAMFLGDSWRVLDPLAAIVVSVFIIKVAIKLLKGSLDELLEKSLPSEVERRIEEIILSCPGASFPHHLRTRSIGNHIAIEVHVRTDGNKSLFRAHSIAHAIEQRLKEEFGPETHVGIHMEPVNPSPEVPATNETLNHET